MTMANKKLHDAFHATTKPINSGVEMAMNLRKYARGKPGPGWIHIGGPVWEHRNTTRVHVIGVVRLPNGTFFHANEYPFAIEANKMIKINGGNRKRGLMAWAIRLSEYPHES